jgi:NTP pyrophosphatase (non-canonical NTP hydrolase)
LDLKALQITLRQFAAERDWQPFHTPKNLAMALMVEAAELAEIFQWMTPEQSQEAGSDLVIQERVADEVADVLLYLVQIADHAGVDLKRAVGRKLVKNTKKHPPVRPGLPSGAALPTPIETHVFVDWENVQPGDDDVRTLVPDVTDIWLFHGPNQKGVGAQHVSFGEKATPVKIARTGKNALDFHLSFYMGYIAARHPAARFVVVSNDKGYAPMLEHAAELGFAARQVGFGSATQRTAKVATTSGAAKKATVAKNAPVKKAPLKKAAASTAGAAVKSALRSKSAATTESSTKLTTAKKAATEEAASSVVVASPAANGKDPVDLSKAVSHVTASLKKTNSRPTRHAKLLSTIKSLLGPSGDEHAVHSVVTQLMASGKVVIDASGGVAYAL